MIQRGRSSVSAKGFVGNLVPAASRALLDGRWRRVVIKREQRRLNRTGAVLLQPICDRLGTIFAEQLFRPVQNRDQADDAFFRRDAASFPNIEVDTKGLRKPPGHVEG